ncbi:MAG: ATP-binding protein [Armatimonadota bacterium]
MSDAISEQIEAVKQSIAALKAQRSTLGDKVVDAAIAPLREKLAELEAQLAQQRAEEVARLRKLATVLFTDVVGSTAIGQRLADPEAIIDVMDEALARMAVPVGEHGGHVTRFMGDGFKAIFGVPVAHEDDAVRAVRAALDILKVVREIAQELEAQEIHGFNARVGINTGLVAAGGLSEGQDTIMGLTVNLGAQLESAAPPGGILISHETYRHVWGLFYILESDPVAAKGFPEPVRAYRVLQAKARPLRPPMRGVEGLETRMVGRTAELRRLQDALEDALETGEGQVITVSGEAGVGKSRLLEEFQNWAELRPEFMWLYQGRGRAEGQGLPYGLLRDVFADRFQILEDDSPEIVREKFIQGVEQGWGEQPDMKAHLLGQLLGYDFRDSPHLRGVGEGEQLRNRGMMYLGEYFREMGRQKPVVMLLEDIHWADDSTLDAVNWLAERMDKLRMLIVCAGRGALYERRPYWGEGQERHARVDLKPLTKRESRELVDDILRHVTHLPEDLSELVVENAEGNPFYLEELIKMLIEDGIIVKGETAWSVAPERLQAVPVPSTLTGVLQARLDGLPPGERKVLQEASVVGRQFWDRVVAYVETGGHAQAAKGLLQERLSSLRGRELIFRRETSAFAQTREFLFKHDLLREVTYESVLKKVRRAHHRLVAEWLMANAGDRIGEYAGLIGEHLILGGREQEAVDYLLWAAEAALGAYSNREAERFCRRALELTSPSVPSEAQRAALLQALGRALACQGKREEAVLVLHDGIELARKLNDPDRLAQLVYQLSDTQWRHVFQQASEEWILCRQAVEELEGAPDSPGLARLLHETGRTAHFAHQPYETIATYCRQALEMAQRLGLVEVELESVITLNMANPNADEAICALQEAATRAESHGLLGIAARAHFDLAYTYEHCEMEDGYAAASEHRLKALELWGRAGDIPQVLFGLHALAWNYTFAGRGPELPALIAETLDDVSVPERLARETRLDIEMPVLFWKGDWAQILTLSRQSATEARRRGDLPAVVYFNSGIDTASTVLADMFGQGDLCEAEAAVRENTDLIEENPLLGARALHVLRLARVKALMGQTEEAQRLLNEGEALLCERDGPGFSPSDTKKGEDMLRSARMRLARAEGRWNDALAIAESNVDRRRRTGDRMRQAYALFVVGDCLHERNGPGDQERARQAYQQSLALFNEMESEGHAQAVRQRLASLPPVP